MKRRAQRQEGIALIEMAIVLPVLILILFAIVELGIAFARFQVVTNAASAGARAAGLFRSGPCNAEVMRQEATNATTAFAGRLGLSAADLAPIVEPTQGGSLCDSETIRVTVSVSKPLAVLSNLIDLKLPLTQTVTEFNLNTLPSNSSSSDS